MYCILLWYYEEVVLWYVLVLKQVKLMYMHVKAVNTHPCSEVHSSPSIEKQCRDIYIPIVRSDMQGCESTLQK